MPNYMSHTRARCAPAHSLLRSNSLICRAGAWPPIIRPFESGMYRTFSVIHSVRLSDVRAPAAGGGKLRMPSASATSLVAVPPLEAAYVSLNRQGLSPPLVAEDLWVQAGGRYLFTRGGAAICGRGQGAIPTAWVLGPQTTY